MNAVSRGIRNTFQNQIPTFSIVAILGFVLGQCQKVRDRFRVVANLHQLVGEVVIRGDMLVDTSMCSTTRYSVIGHCGEIHR